MLFSFIYTFIFPSLMQYLSYRSNIFNKFNKLLKYIYLKLNLNFLKGYTFYFILGYYLNKKIKINILFASLLMSIMKIITKFLFI